jgi:hypothetical protein
MSEKSTLQMTVELTVEGVPAGTLKAAELIETDVELQRSPAVASDCDPASCPAVAAAFADRDSDAARAAVCAASLTVVRANHNRPPATSSPTTSSSAGTSSVSSTVAAPRWLGAVQAELMIMAGWPVPAALWQPQ